MTDNHDNNYDNNNDDDYRDHDDDGDDVVCIRVLDCVMMMITMMMVNELKISSQLIMISSKNSVISSQLIDKFTFDVHTRAELIVRVFVFGGSFAPEFIFCCAWGMQD